ncbi:MAG: alpha/beta hydrolase [Lachnospiraceae bacterium]|nr:alpha/beta hydrolase [Lachnospiraceae bacterium]
MSMIERSEKVHDIKSGKKRRIIIILSFVTALLIVLYFILVNFLVSAALVPSFMEKLESFERITNDSYEAQVHTSDIKVNRQFAINDTEEWLETVERRKISAETEDGYTLVAEEFLSDENNHKWALVLHGYTGWKEEMYPFAHWYYEEGYHVIAPDLRCQGESEGDFIGMGWTDHYDCALWISYILSRDSDARIVIHGQSMGAATALMMTGEEDISPNICAVVSDCAYTDAYSMFGEKIKQWFYLPAFPIVDTACLVLRIRGGYNLKDASAINAVKKSDTPTLFIHGDADAMISVEMTKQLYDAANCPKELLIVEGAGHAQSQDKDPDTYYGTIRAFLETVIQE